MWVQKTAAEQLRQALDLPRRIDLLDLVAELAQQSRGVRNGRRGLRVDDGVRHRRQRRRRDPQPAGRRAAAAAANGSRRRRRPAWRRRPRSRRARRGSPRCPRPCASARRRSRAATRRVRAPPRSARAGGFRPTRPQHAAGIRIEPPPSLPCATGTMPAATAAAAPPEEPPGVRSRSHGLRVGPNSRASLVGRIPYSGSVVVPTMTKPASLEAARDVVVVVGDEVPHQRAAVASAAARSPAGCS